MVRCSQEKLCKAEVTVSYLCLRTFQHPVQFSCCCVTKHESLGMVRWEVVGGWRSRKAWSLGASFGGREVGGHAHIPEDFFF